MNEPSRLDRISTRWTLLREAHASSPAAGAARQALVLRYRTAVTRYVHAMVPNAADAEDLAQDIVTRLMSGDFAGADPSRGRFRDLLKTAIRNMVYNHANRKKRRRTVDVELDWIADSRGEEDAEWLTAWRTSVLDLAWQAIQQEQRVRPGGHAYTLLRMRADYPEDSSEELAARFSQQVGETVRADALRQKLRRARMRFVDLLIAEVGNGLNDPTPERIEEELGSLGLLEFFDGLMPNRG